MNRRVAAGALLAIVSVTGACDHSGPGKGGRSYFMGFSAIPPSPDPTQQIPTLTVAAAHSDAGLIQLSIPWTTLLAGTTAPDEVRIVRLPLVQYYRGSGKVIVVALDVTDGLNRAAEDPALVAAGRSITEPAIQALYLEYVAAVDTILHPEYMSLAAETNLVRAIAPGSVYSAVVTMVNDAATALIAAGTSAHLMTSVQVETAWGALGGGGTYVGIDQDRTDFPFLDALGLSSYPYLAGYEDPDDVPDNYYSRLVESDPIPVVVLEGGWPSKSVGPVTSSLTEQAHYIARQAALLDEAGAAGLMQITFTDLATSLFPPPTNTGLIPFAYNGLVDTVLAAKPSLAVWDSVLAQRNRP